MVRPNQRNRQAARSNQSSTTPTPISYDSYHEQQLLDLFFRTFTDILQDPPVLNRRIQDVKAALFDRDYNAAFGSQENLEAYVARWTPSRALAYTSLLDSLIGAALFEQPSSEPKRVLSIGGGAGAEIVALGTLTLLGGRHTGGAKSTQEVHVVAVDLAEWGPVVDKLTGYMAQNWVPPQSTDLSIDNAMAHLSIGSTSSSPFKVHFINHDILTLPAEAYDISRLDLITSMFTTNELFTSSKSGTVQFLHSLAACHSGALLLFVESAGSYSEVTVGSKVFPVHFLIHHVLTQNNHWELITSSDSQWYRLSPDLSYPMQLENMRYFYRLYRRT